MARRLDIFLVIIGLLGLSGCNMDLYRSDTMTSAQFKSDPGAAVYSTDGNYAMFKDPMQYRGKSDNGLTFIKMWNHMTEMRGDNAMLSGTTSSPIYNSACYDDTPELKHSYYFWWCCYKIIYSANSIIEMLPEGEPKNNQLLGENYFMRAFCHLCLSCLYSKQYPLGRENPGVVLRTSTDCSETFRSTVGEVYDQIEADLKKAVELMKDTTPRGDAGYLSYNAARALLSRVYLYMEKNQECLDICNEMLGSNPAANLETDLDTYFTRARSSKETLWCIACTMSDAVGRSSLGSMYYSPNGTGGVGWGEVYWTDPLIELFQRYPGDKRFAAYFSLYGKLNDGTKMVHWPIDDGKNFFRSNAIVAGRDKGMTPIDADGNVRFTYQDKTYTTVRKSVKGVNNGYPQYFIQYNGAETQVYVRDNTDFASGVRNTYPQYYMSKFANQDGDPNLASPVMLRWAEVILNRAEAEAKLGKDADAIKDVNVLRKRAGIPEWGSLAEAQTHEYKDALDVVLDERRMELCFEAQRPFDLIRNKRNINHKFAGVQPWKEYPYDCDEFLFAIPADEILVSGIPQNPGKGTNK